MCALLSAAIGNILVLTKVVALWENDRVRDHLEYRMSPLTCLIADPFALVRVIHYSVWLIHNGLLNMDWYKYLYVTRSSERVVISCHAASISYEPLLSMCVLTRAHPLLIPAWAAPLVFEVLILVTTYWNAVDRPRRITESLASTLRKDGMTLYAIMAILRVFSLALVATQDARLVLLSVLFVFRFLCRVVC
jgi:hypothetical protein